MSKNTKQKKITVWHMIYKILPQVVSVSPKLFVFNSTLFILDGALFPVSIWGMQILFDNVTNLGSNKGSINDAILALLLLFTIQIVQQIINGIDNFIGETYDPKVSGKLSHIINMKMARLDPISFENPEILDDINKSYNGIRFAINFINTITDVMTFYVPSFIFTGLYLFTLKPILAVSLLLVFFPVLLTQLIRVKVFSKLEDDSTPLRRKTKYYEDCLTGREYIKETRILGASPYFIKLFKEALVNMNHLKWKADVKTNLIELSTKLISLGGYMGILWMLFNALMNQEITVGAFAAVFASIDRLFDLMEGLICGRLGYYASNFGKVQNYLRFLELPERVGEDNFSSETFHGDITLENVTFSYPQSNKNAVENINLTIKQGETIAVVGENGSGKSTLIRLLTGLYIPKEGKVLHNNKSTKEYTPRTLFEGISGVFQKFQRYQLSLEDNITISDMDERSKDKEDMKYASKKAGIDLNTKTFPDEFNTILSREFKGVDLSGGQWQRIAIARGFYREHELIILDEPTAAIDPVEEVKIYEQFAEISKNKTAVVVTHRLGSVKFADRIVVMDRGKIIGEGSHEQLLSNCPLYADMWESQAQHYTISDTLLGVS